MNEASESAARTGMSAPHTTSPKKILIVRLGAMGDVIHALPAVVMLREAWPEAKIGWVIERRWRELVNFPRLIDRIHEVDTRGWRKELWKCRHEIGTALRELRAEGYEVAVDFQGAIKSALIAAASGAQRRYGFANAWEKPASMFYTHGLVTQSTHVVEQNEELAADAIIHEHGTAAAKAAVSRLTIRSRLKPCPSENELELGDLSLGTQFVMLNPGAGWGAKEWPVERYAEVAKRLGAQGIRSLVNYGPGEEELARKVQRGSDGNAVSASFDIAQLMAVTGRASLFIGGDTGPMHLAALLQVPVVAIFGPTDPARNGPFWTRSIVLRDRTSVTSHKRIHETEAGLLKITTEQVLKAARDLLADESGGPRE